MIDSTYVKDGQHLSDARGENPAISKTKECSIENTFSCK